MVDLFTDPDWRPSGTYRPSRRRRGGLRLMILAGLAVLGAGGGALWFMLSRPIPINEVPVIQPQTAAVKERPADPGGVEVLHKDATVYERLDKRASRDKTIKPVAKTEQLLPPPEQPDVAALTRPKQPTPAPVTAVAAAALPAPKPIAAPAAIGAPQTVGLVAEPKTAPVPVAAKPLTTAPSPFLSPEQLAQKTVKPSPNAADKPVGKSVDKLVEQVLAPPPAVTVTTETAATAEKPLLDTKALLARSGVSSAVEAAADTAPSPRPVEKAVDKPLDKPLDKPADKPVNDTVDNRPLAAADPTDTPANNGLRRVQLASSPDRAATEQKMLGMVAEHAALLRQNKLMVNRAEISGRGTYYRIQTQALPAADAASLCTKLKTAGLACLLVKATP
jgi:hypothetical protein